MASIIIVDDAPDAAEALAGLLEREGHRVRSLLNGSDALAEVIRDPPDLLMVDLAMPRMNGAQFLQLLRSYVRLQSLPVIIWTGLPDNDPLVDQARACKANAVLIKGRDSFEEVENTVQRVVHAPPH